jgi:membrane protease YdiL (CAAX protease family)
VQHADGRRLTLALKPDRSWADNARTQLLRAVCAYSCLVLAVLLLALVAFRAHQAGVRGRWPLLLGGWFATMLPGLPLKLADYGVIPAPHQTSLLFCGELLLLFAALGLWRTMDAHDPASPLPERDVPYTFFVGAAFTASWLTRCGLLLAAVSFRFDVNIGPSQSFVSMLERPHSGAEQWLLGATVALLAPIAEELLFRGALFGWLNRFLSPWSSIGVSAALFTAAHAPTHGGYLLHIAALAVVFGWMRYRSGSLHPSMMLHVAINAAAFLQILRS